MTNTSILQKIKRGGDDLPPRVLLSGTIGIGKSTFAANAPQPLFVCSEDGLTGLEHIERIVPQTYHEILALIDALIASETVEYQTLVFDTTDWLEQMIQAYVCFRDDKVRVVENITEWGEKRQEKVPDIESYGFAKGYIAVEQEARLLFSKLDILRHKHKMLIILLSHVSVKTVTKPNQDPFDGYVLRGNGKFTSVITEWADAVLFALMESHTFEDKKKRTERTVLGERTLHTAANATWEAKNRLGLPETLPLDFDAFWRAVEMNKPAVLRAHYLALRETAVYDTDKQRAAALAEKAESLNPLQLKTRIEKLLARQPAEGKSNSTASTPSTSSSGTAAQSNQE